jgi:hypothetical protein
LLGWAWLRALWRWAWLRALWRWAWLRALWGWAYRRRLAGLFALLLLIRHPSSLASESEKNYTIVFIRSDSYRERSQNLYIEGIFLPSARIYFKFL